MLTSWQPAGQPARGTQLHFAGHSTFNWAWVRVAPSAFVSYSVLESHLVASLHLRSEVAVGAADRYWVLASQTVRAVHLRSEVSVGASDWYCVSGSQTERGWHLLSASA